MSLAASSRVGDVILPSGADRAAGTAVKFYELRDNRRYWGQSRYSATTSPACSRVT